MCLSVPVLAKKMSLAAPWVVRLAVWLNWYGLKGLQACMTQSLFFDDCRASLAQYSKSSDFRTVDPTLCLRRFEQQIVLTILSFKIVLSRRD